MLRSGRLLARTVASAFGAQEHTVRPELDVLAEFLAGHRALPVLDNCEHLITAVATLAFELLAAAPELRILATSRRRLSVPGEHVLAVEPLPVGPAPQQGRPGSSRRCGKAVHRAGRGQRQRVPAHGQNVETVRTLCDRLEGIPLALELTAALGLPGPPPAPGPAAIAPARALTRREERIAVLAGEGASPAAVAGLLRLSRTEMESQLAAILGALNLSDPERLAARASTRPFPDGDAPDASPTAHAT
ncbi:hypothetical protein [Streptomyces violascens]|uniref:hypothetical protein n=1 Tax=Streptomyces violascens TaxID=67381 RepID=UPI001672C66E|nr:hypothetical protein [Streptomyces violascens]